MKNRIIAAIILITSISLTAYGDNSEENNGCPHLAHRGQTMAFCSISVQPQSKAKELLSSKQAAALNKTLSQCWKARSELLNNSSGTVNFTIQRNEESWQQQEVESVKTRLTGRGADPDKINFFVGKGKWTTKWFKKGLKNRYDVVAPPSTEKDSSSKPLIIERNIRIVATPEGGLNYNLLSKEAVINNPPASNAVNPFSLLGNFNIEKLYQIMGKDILEQLDFWDKKEGDRKITKEKIGQIDCIKVEYNLEKVMKGKDRIRKKNISFWFAPEMSYSMVKSQFFCNNITSPDELTLLYDYEASYEESEQFKGIWLLKDLTIIDKSGIVSETLTASIKETKIGINIPDKTFTLEGLELPPKHVMFKGEELSIKDLFEVDIPEGATNIKCEVIDTDPLHGLHWDAFLRFDMSDELAKDIEKTIRNNKAPVGYMYKKIVQRDDTPAWWTVEPSARFDRSGKKMFGRVGPGPVFIIPMPNGDKRFYKTVYRHIRNRTEQENVESFLGVRFPGPVSNWKYNLFSTPVGDSCQKVRFDIRREHLIAALDNAPKISFKYSDLKQDQELVEKVCMIGPVKDKLEFWQQQNQANIICASQSEGQWSGHMIYVGIETLDDDNVRVYFMYSTWCH